jgi:hypothetical protein
MNSIQAAENLGMMTMTNGFDNELEIIQTKTLNRRVVRDLKLYTKYVLEGKLKDHEIYGKYSPYTIDMLGDELDSLKTGVSAEIRQKGKGITITIKTLGTEIVKDVNSFPGKIVTPAGTLYVDKNPLIKEGNLGDRTLLAMLNPVDAIAGAYAGGLSVSPSSKTTTISTTRTSSSTCWCASTSTPPTAVPSSA